LLLRDSTGGITVFVFILVAGPATHLLAGPCWPPPASCSHCCPSHVRPVTRTARSRWQPVGRVLALSV